jgi:hypothetical protein
MTKQKKDNYLDANKEPPTHKEGIPWTKVGIFKTFEEADKKRFSVIADEPTFKTKVKRCGTDGSQFMVKKREDPTLAKISKEIDEISEKHKAKKKRTPSKKKRRTASE